MKESCKKLGSYLFKKMCLFIHIRSARKFLLNNYNFTILFILLMGKVRKLVFCYQFCGQPYQQSKY